MSGNCAADVTSDSSSKEMTNNSSCLLDTAALSRNDDILRLLLNFGFGRFLRE
jgi:hypothetical protein